MNQFDLNKLRGINMHYYAVCMNKIDVMKVGFLESFPSGKKQVSDADIIKCIQTSPKIVLFTTEEDAIHFADYQTNLEYSTSADDYTKYTPLIKVLLKKADNVNTESMYGKPRAVTPNSNIASISFYAYKFGTHSAPKLVKKDLGEEVYLEELSDSKCSIS